MSSKVELVIPDDCSQCGCEYDKITCGLCCMPFNFETYPKKPEWCPLVYFAVKVAEDE